MDQRVGLIFLPIFLAGCAGAPAATTSARVASELPAEQRTAAHSPAAGGHVENVAASPKASPAAPLEYDDEAATARRFVDYTKRTIDLYREFIEKAGTDPQYAAAVKRSREQIQDLNDTLIFVRSGNKER